MKNFLVCVPYASDFSIIKVIFYFCLIYQIQYILFLTATECAHRKLSSASALLSQSYRPALKCAVHTSTKTPHIFPPHPDSPFAWSSNLKQTVKQNNSLAIIFLTAQSLNNHFTIATNFLFHHSHHHNIILFFCVLNCSKIILLQNF